MTSNDLAGGYQPLAEFRTVWVTDFEFQLDGGLPIPLCMVAREWRSGQEIRCWRDDLLRLRAAPFDVGANDLFVAFVATAELTCFLALGWPLPDNVLDLSPEHKLSCNYGKAGPQPPPWSLVKALQMRGQTHLMFEDKAEMVDLILRNIDYTPEQRQDILDYCWSDVEATVRLLDVMLPEIDLPRAIHFRGRYVRAVARMEHTGVPLDVAMYHDLKAHLPDLRGELIDAVNADLNVFVDGSFNLALFEKFLAAEGLNWPRTETGLPNTKLDYLRTRADGHEKLTALYELRSTLKMIEAMNQPEDPRKRRLALSSDGFARCPYWPFGSATARNQPKASQFIFGPAKWLRGLIKPPPGYAIAYCDWSQQEIALAAGLSGDPELRKAYLSGDVYTAMAKASGAIPPDGCKEDYELIRDDWKRVVLGMGYGMHWRSIARDKNMPGQKAKAIYTSHRRLYRVFWNWIEAIIRTAVLRDRFIQDAWGWRQLINAETKTLTLQNFPMQTAGSTTMMLSAILATEAGLTLCCAVHDAFLLMSRCETIEQDVQQLKQIMTEAGRLVCGIPIRVDDSIIRYPDRYQDKRGVRMWTRITDLVAAHKRLRNDLQPLTFESVA